MPKQALRHPSILATQLNSSAQTATSVALTEFIIAGIASNLRHLKSHPDDAHAVYQLFRPVTDKTLTQDVLCVVHETIVEEIKKI
jgi:hypothetical protein